MLGSMYISFPNILIGFLLGWMQASPPKHKVWPHKSANCGKFMFNKFISGIRCYTLYLYWGHKFVLVGWHSGQSIGASGS